MAIGLTQLGLNPVGLTTLVGASAGNNAVWSAAGGMVIAGSSVQLRSTMKLPSGGVSLSGNAAESSTNLKSAIWTPSGGISFSGAASRIGSVIKTAIGGLLFGGVASSIFHRAGASLATAWYIFARRRGRK